MWREYLFTFHKQLWIKFGVNKEQFIYSNLQIKNNKNSVLYVVYLNKTYEEEI